MIKTFVRLESFTSDDISIHLVDIMGHSQSYCTRLEFEEMPLGSSPISNCPIRLKTEEAQRLMDQLWDVGIRPSEGTGSAGSLAATQKHLEDMRTLVFKTLHLTKENRR